MFEIHPQRMRLGFCHIIVITSVSTQHTNHLKKVCHYYINEQIQIIQIRIKKKTVAYDKIHNNQHTLT